MVGNNGRSTEFFPTRHAKHAKHAILRHADPVPNVQNHVTFRIPVRDTLLFYVIFLRLVVYTAGVHFAMENLSTYALSLPAEAKKRYLEKINIVGSLDPFAGSLGACTDAVPPVDE